MVRIITFLIVFFKKVDFPMSQINVSKTLSQKVSKHIVIIAKKPLWKGSYSGTALLHDGQILFGIARC